MTGVFCVEIDGRKGDPLTEAALVAPIPVPEEDLIPRESAEDVTGTLDDLVVRGGVAFEADVDVESNDEEELFFFDGVEMDDIEGSTTTAAATSADDLSEI